MLEELLHTIQEEKVNVGIQNNLIDGTWSVIIWTRKFPEGYYNRGVELGPTLKIAFEMAKKDGRE